MFRRRMRIVATLMWLAIACGGLACTRTHHEDGRGNSRTSADAFWRVQRKSYRVEERNESAASDGGEFGELTHASPLLGIRVLSAASEVQAGRIRIVQTLVQDLVSPRSGCRVRIISTCHLAREEYWADIQSLAQGADWVIVEGIRRTSSARVEPPETGASKVVDAASQSRISLIARYRSAEAIVTGWTTQSKWLREHRRANWVGADMSAAEFLKHPSNGVGRASGELDDAWRRTLSTIEAVARGETVRGITPEGARTYLRDRFADQMSDTITSADQLNERTREVDSARERIALSKLHEIISTEPNSYVVMIYGAAHTPRMVAEIRRALGMSLRRFAWIDAAYAR